MRTPLAVAGRAYVLAEGRIVAGGPRRRCSPSPTSGAPTSGTRNPGAGTAHG